jgi:UDP:flavonoid glycosyltransferase YjiC (YdhE family)
MSRRVLFACWPFEGHVFPLMSIALAERARGGEVAFYTGRRLQATIESQAIEVFPFDRVEGAWTRVHAMERAVGAGRRSLRVQREAFRQWLVESIPDQVADLRAVIDRWRPDVLVTDGSMWGPSVILHETGPTPVALVSTLLYALVPGPGAPPPGTRLGVPHSAATRALAWGAASGVGSARRVLGQVVGGTEGEELLVDAVEVETVVTTEEAER